MTYTVLEKDLFTQTVLVAATFARLQDAENWVDQMSYIWEEYRGYKIVEGTTQ
jgi:hypothetical protein